MGRKSISIKIQKELYAKSGNMCAFPNCSVKFYDEDSNNVSNICHIEAYNKGARHNSSLSEEECNDINNLILLCANHHRIIDADEEKYTVEILKKMKKDHEDYIANYKESNYKESKFNFSDDLLEDFFDYSKEEINSVLKSIERLNIEYKEVLFFTLIDSADNGSIDLKYIKATTKFGNLSEIVEVLEESRYIFEFKYVGYNALIEGDDGSVFLVDGNYDFKIVNGKWQLGRNGDILKVIFNILNKDEEKFYKLLVNNNYNVLDNRL